MAAAARLRAFYFFYFAGVGVTTPYYAPYFRGLCPSGSEIGAVQMVGPLLAAPVGLAWAALADRLGAPARALRVAAALAFVAQVLMPLAGDVWSVGAIMLATGLFQPALVPLVDAVTVESLSRSGGSYPRTRLFGSLGYVVLAQGLGVALAARGDRPADALVPLAMVGCALAYAVAAQRLPDPPTHEAADPGGGRAHLRDALALLRDRRIVLLLAASAFHWGACAPYHLLFGVFVREHGLPASLTGLGSTAGVVAEVGVLLVAGRLEARFSPDALFGAAFAATALRWALLAHAATAPALVLLQLLHGFTFGLFWATVVRALTLYVPARLRATGQALFSAVVFGAGNAIGLQLAGWGLDRYGSVGPLYGWAAAVELVPLALVLAFGRR